jgi:hypothetical protein
MDNLLIALVFVVIAALSNWLQRRAQSQQQPPAKKPQPMPRPSSPMAPPARAPAAPPPVNPRRSPLETALERELKRLLGEDLPAAPPPQRPVTRPAENDEPPVILHRPPHLPRVPLPQVAAALPAPSLAPVAVPALAELSQASSRFSQAKNLHESVAERLRKVDELTNRHAPQPVMIPARLVPSPSYTILQAVRDPAAVRQAFVASLIFAPPKALE